ncbi:glycosyl transferase family 1 [Leptolyngbya sp. 'hensonii']|nr:glycosyl transferase family 1 [Leptolyngbya sp. 'hensonii']
MRILIHAPLFYPSVGGTETVVSILAHEFVARGHAVTIVTRTPDPGHTPFPFRVVRCPSQGELLALVRQTQVYFMANVSLKGIWPWFLSRKPLVIMHQSWYSRLDGRVAWQDALKYQLTRFAANISASQAIADHLPSPSTVVGNPYRDDLFRELPAVRRDRELVFLGRLVSDKGVDLLLDALAALRNQDLHPQLTIIGSGPEESRLRQQTIQLGLSDQVTFVGTQVGEDLVQLLNAHRILVVPSRWEEPFGIVALEGMACGCVVVGSAGGGLTDAIGPAGFTFPNEDLGAFTQTLATLLTNPDVWVACKAQAPLHLARHRRAAVASAYLQVIESHVVESENP